MNILSVDFDYFIDTDINIRNNIFPDGLDFQDEETTKKNWENVYHNHPEIKNIGVINDYYTLMGFLITHHIPKISVQDNHGCIMKVIESMCDTNTPINMVNIDFHHDNYISSGNTLDCANWVRFLTDNYPNSSVKWVKRADSETVSLLGEFPYEMTNDLSEVLNTDYDLIFFCFSPEWTPPHLRGFYVDLIKEACNK